VALANLEDRAMLESNLSAGLDSAAMRIGNELFPILNFIAGELKR